MYSANMEINESSVLAMRELNRIFQLEKLLPAEGTKNNFVVTFAA